MMFRSNGLSVKRCPAKWRLVNQLFREKAFGQKKIGEMIQNLDVPVKLCAVEIISAKWY
jgi:hypothetical protein